MSDDFEEPEGLIAEKSQIFQELEQEVDHDPVLELVRADIDESSPTPQV